jgi:membrane protein DedA with SNARE-associated domain
VIERLIASSPYIGIYVALCLGGIGLPLPEEVPIVTAGVLAHKDVVRWWLALATCIAGVLTGDLVLYWTGRRWGERVLDLPLVARFLDAKRRDSLEASYRRHGVLIVFAARHVMGLRAAAFVTAGIVKLSFWKFMAADGLAIAYGVPLNFAIAYFWRLPTKKGGGVPQEGGSPNRWRGIRGACRSAALRKTLGGIRGERRAPPDHGQCAMNTGTVMVRKISRVAPPSTNSRRRD